MRVWLIRRMSLFALLTMCMLSSCGVHMTRGASPGAVDLEPVRSTLTENDRVIYVQGTSGFLHWGDRRIRKGLAKAGFSALVTAHQWHASRPPAFPVINRGEYELVHLAAQSLADRIVAEKSDPGTRVYLVTQSAGCEVVRIALGLLPRGVQVENVVMCGPSMSPEVDFGEALGAVAGKIYYQCSWLDFGLLGVGTWLIGSTNRKHCVCAGVVGFKPPPEADENLRRLYAEKLVPVRWRPSFARRGYLGGHFTQQAVPHVAANISRMLAGDWQDER